MNKQLLVALSLLLLIVGFFSYRHFRSSPDNSSSPASQVKSKDDTPLTKPTATKSEATTQSQTSMELALDDDPVGSLRLEGQAVDEDGDPVEGATIMLGSAPPRTTTSDTDGSFAFDNLVGRRYPIYARSSDRIGGPVVVRLTEESPPALIRMHAGGGIEVEVYDRENHPIAGATISIPSLDSISATTDSEGKVTIDNLPPGNTLLSARAPGFAKSTSYVSIPRAADTRSHQRFDLVPGIKVSGIVVDKDDKPVAGAKLIAHDTSALFSVENPKKDGVVSDKEGRFELPAVPPGSIRLHAVHDDYAPSFGDILQVGDTELSSITLRMSEGGKISGKVVSSSGAPVSWATVRVVAGGDSPNRSVNRQLIADEEGEFAIRGLTPVELLVYASSDLASSKAIDIDLRSSPTKENLEVRLDVEGTLSGIVVDQEGEAIAEAQVQAIPNFWDGADLKTMTASGPSFATTDGSGAFVFHGLSDSKFQLRASRSLGDLSTGLNKATNARTGDTGIKIIIASPGSVEGTVQRSDGNAPEIATVSIGRASASVKKGAFLLTDIPPGKYELAVSGPSFATRYVGNIVVKTSEKLKLETIVVEKGRSVRGRVVDSSGSAVSGAKVVLAERVISDGKNLIPQNIGDSVTDGGGLRQAVSDDEGRFVLSGLGPKEWTVVADHPEFGRALGIQIAKGIADEEIELPLLEVGRIAGKVSINGEGKPNIQVLLTSPSSSGHILVVRSGADGSFLVERTAAGEYKLSAMMGGGASTSMAAMQVVVKAGQEVEANLNVDEGSVTYIVKVTGIKGAKIDAAQVFLFQGAANIKTGGELNDLFLKSANNAKMEFTSDEMGPASFKKVTPGLYSVCVIPINGDMNDPVFGQKLQRNAATLAVHCLQSEVLESPEKQSFNAVVPPMAPLPED